MATLIDDRKLAEAVPGAPAVATLPAAQPDHKPSPVDSPESKFERYPDGINWYVVGWLVLLHVGALAAPWTFTWTALAVTVVLHWLTGSIGVCLGYHRLLTHRSFATYRPIRWLVAWIGGLSGEGSAIDWVANHRKHHAHSDKDGDPHSPHHGTWWSHAFWLGRAMPAAKYEAHVKRWAPDLAQDKGLVFLARTFLLWQFVVGGATMAAGYAIGGWPMAWSFLVWAVFVRLVAVLHTTWFVNSASHIWGYKNYATTDDSRNNWWVALLAYGEGWHNNHHAYPTMVKHGHRWWEVDMTYMFIKLMEKCGLAWNLVTYQRRTHDSAM